MKHIVITNIYVREHMVLQYQHDRELDHSSTATLHEHSTSKALAQGGEEGGSTYSTAFPPAQSSQKNTAPMSGKVANDFDQG